MKQNRMFSDLLNPLYEGCDLENLCVATYLVGAEKDEGIVIKASVLSRQPAPGWMCRLKRMRCGQNIALK